jgi:prolyl-tRNA synthetase
VLAVASGGDFSKYSHEFQTLCEAGEDVIYLCGKCNVAVNKEIVDDQSVCPDCEKKDLTETRAIEVGNIFKLGTRFPDAFGFQYVDEDGKKRPVVMAAYGIGPSRLMGTIVEVFNDKDGILWPESVAPYRVHLIGLDLEDEKIAKRAREVYDQLEKAGVEVLFDDRKEISAGEKFSEADLIGIPWRVVVSKRTGEQVELKRRGEDGEKLIDTERFVESIE